MTCRPSPMRGSAAPPMPPAMRAWDALRYENWKIVFLEQRAAGTLNIWAEPFAPLRVPRIFNLRTDP